jgi:hypothetical protein
MSETAQASQIAEINDEMQTDLAILKSLQDLRPSEDVLHQIEVTRARMRRSRQQLQSLQSTGMALQLSSGLLSKEFNLRYLGSTSGGRHSTGTESSSSGLGKTILCLEREKTNSGKAAFTPSSSERSSRMHSPDHHGFQPADSASRKRTLSAVVDVKAEPHADFKSQRHSLNSSARSRETSGGQSSYQFLEDADGVIDLTGLVHSSSSSIVSLPFWPEGSGSFVVHLRLQTPDEVSNLWQD